MTDARFGPALRAVLTTPEHSAMMDTIEENLANSGSSGSTSTASRTNKP
jgi:hypothetical protein